MNVKFECVMCHKIEYVTAPLYHFVAYCPTVHTVCLECTDKR